MGAEIPAVPPETKDTTLEVTPIPTMPESAMEPEDNIPAPTLRWTLWRLVASLWLLTVGLEAVPIIFSLYSGSVSAFMIHWAEIDASVAMVLTFLLVLVSWQQRPQELRLYQAVGAVWLLTVGLETIQIIIYLWVEPLSELMMQWVKVNAIIIAALTAILLILWQRHIHAKYKAKRLSEITVYSYPKLVYVWPIIALGYVFLFSPSWDWVNSSTIAWIYLGVMVTVFLTVCIDLDRIASLLWLSLIIIITLGYTVIRLYFGATFLDDIGRWFASLSPDYPAQFCYVIGILLTIPYVIMIIGTRANNPWDISHNQIEHRSFLGKDDVHARGAKRVKVTYPDMLELLLLGSGTLTVYTAQGNHIIAEIRNIPLLIFRMGRIDRILEALEVSPQTIEEEAGETDGGTDEDASEHV